MSRRILFISVAILLVSFGFVRATSESLTGTEIAQTAEEEPCFAEGLPCRGVDEAAAPVALPITPGTQYRTYPGTSFKPTSSNLTYEASGAAIRALAIPPGGFSFMRQLELPQGARVTEVAFFFVDNTATAISLELIYSDPTGAGFPTILSRTSSGASAAIRNIVATGSPIVTIDNATNSYWLRVVFGEASSGQQLQGARVGYTMGAFLPLLAR